LGNEPGGSPNGRLALQITELLATERPTTGNATPGSGDRAMMATDEQEAKRSLMRGLLIRHGRSTWNAERRWQGWADPPPVT
jgi:hypothetical protein